MAREEHPRALQGPLEESVRALLGARTLRGVAVVTTAMVSVGQGGGKVC